MQGTYRTLVLSASRDGHLLRVPTQISLYFAVFIYAYGFAAYMIENNSFHLIFAKVKVASTKTKTLPTLELLSVYLALKCRLLLLKNYKNIKKEDVYMVVDAQVVLSWLLSQFITTENIFTKNCLIDIQMIKQATTRFFHRTCI